MRVGWKSILLILAVLVVTVYVGVMSVMPRDRDAHQRRCQQIECYFEDSTAHRYMTDQQVEKYLRQVGLNPVGKTMSEINLQAIEDSLQAHPILASADCYMTIDGNLCIHLTQRTPIVHDGYGELLRSYRPRTGACMVHDTRYGAGGARPAHP